MAYIEKTWVVTSDNPRPSHAAMDGETVAMQDPFSNGLFFPGDSLNGDIEETAGCTCVLSIGGTVDSTTTVSNDFLGAADVTRGEDIGRGISGAQWGTAKLGDIVTDVVVKPIDQPKFGQAELAAQDFASRFGFGIDTPAIVQREGLGGSYRDFLVSQKMEGGLIYDLPYTQGADLLLRDPDKVLPVEERTRIAFFDTVVGNPDRNNGNFLIQGLEGSVEDRHIVAIDHGFAFSRNLESTLTGSDPIGSTIREYLLKSPLGRSLGPSMETGTGGIDFTLTDAQRATLEKIVSPDEDEYMTGWRDKNVDVDAVRARAQYMLDHGRWDGGGA